MAHNEDYSQIWAADDHADGINIWEVAAALGRNTGDLGKLCGDLAYDDNLHEWVRANAINKWARFKPIKYYNKLDALGNDEFEGTISDQQSGIHFGLEIVPGGTLTGNTASWPLLHGTRYLYHPPTGGAAYPYRLSDFTSIEGTPTGRPHPLGYDKNAMPNPSGVFNSNLGNYEQYLSDIFGGYYDANALGVDLSHILIGPSEDPTGVLALTYMCILVSDTTNNLHYFTTLDADDDGLPYPLYYQDAYLRGPWHANFNKNVHGGSSNPFTDPQSGLKMTLFLLRLPSIQYLTLRNGHYYPCLSINGTIIDDYWFDCNDSILTSFIPVPLPNAVNKDLTLQAIYAGIKVRATGAALNLSGNLQVFLEKEQYSSTTMDFTSTVAVDYQGNVATKTITGSSTDSAVSTQTFTPSDFGELQFTPGATVRITVTTVVQNVGTQVTYSQFVI